MIHRDLKPDNVLIERDTDRAVITDFGIARGGDEATVTKIGSVIGTPRYMAPEQLAGREVDMRADLFSLGVMLFELATGHRPWPGSSSVALAVAQATQAPRAFVADGVPETFPTLVGQCLELEPDRRPATAEAIGAAIASGTAATVEPGTDERSTRAVRPQITNLRQSASELDPRGQASVLEPHAQASRFGPRGPLPQGPPTPSRTQCADDPRPDSTIAVLPFACAAGDEYLADGVVEDLIDTLSTTPSLRVRPASMSRQRNETDPRELGRQLEVDHVVVGSVRRGASNLRLTTRLISVADGFQIWAHRAECTEAEILTVSDQLGRGIAAALSTRANDSKRPTDPRAVELYLRARGELRRFWGAHVQAAADLLEHAAAYSPTSAPILGALACASVQAWVMRGVPELAERARCAVERGLATGHGEAFLASAVFRINHGDLEGGAQDLGTALLRAPMSAQAHEVAGRMLLELDALHEGHHHLETAVGLDAGRTLIVSADLLRIQALQGEWASADQRVHELISHPDPSIMQMGVVFEARLAGWRNDRAGMIAACSRFTPRMGDNASLILGWIRECVEAGTITNDGWLRIGQVFMGPDRPTRMQVLGLQLMSEVALMLGHRDEGLSALRRAEELGLVDITWMLLCPLFVGLSDDPRWQSIRHDVGARAAGVLAAYRAAC